MGGCVSGRSQNEPTELSPTKAVRQTAKEYSKFDKIELHLLGLMYEDLAKRSADNIVSRQTFQVFFHNSGLMAELMFSKFDYKKTGGILKEEFLKAFEINVKGSFEERANSLFEFYSMERSGEIRYSELLRILLSYPLEDLNSMLFEEPFLKELGESMIIYYFGPEKRISEKIIMEENSEQSNSDTEPRKHGSLYNPTSKDLLQIQGRIRQIVEEEKLNKNEKLGVPPLFEKQNGHNHTAKHPRLEKIITDSKLKKSGSMSLIELKKIRKSCKLKSNITSLVKRYATYLFTSANLDRDKDIFSKKQFSDLLKAHPSVFDVYCAGFHKYAWEVDSLGRPLYFSMQAEVEGEGKMWVVHNPEPAVSYFKLIKSTILIFEEKLEMEAKDMINLQGLIVEFNNQNDKKSVNLRHRDGIYPEKKIVFLQKEDDWLRLLKVFQKSSILENYLKLQRIGKGSFSTVYRCKSKSTDSYAALKVIEPKKLSPGERDIVKREIGILKQCHHQNIVKFIQQYKTNTHIYIITELLSEGDLFDYTRKKSFLEEYEASIIFRQLTEAILYLNQMGIIHRDLKPENIMIIMGEGKKIVKRVKIIDFGFGVYKDQLKELTEDEKYAGTPGFIAPEVYEMQEYDYKIDTFSLGIILYFMLYGYLPFQANYVEQIRDLTLSCNISLKNDHWSNVSEDAKTLIYKLLTFANKRITTKQILEHPWLKNTERLKEYQGRNKKRVKILD